MEEATEKKREVIERALAYPFATPEGSFALVEGEAQDLGAAEVDGSTRVPLLAYGSNAAPVSLCRKLGPGADPLPVIRATLHDFDAVYSAHVASYGSVPATLLRSRGTELAAFVAFPTDEQLERISATEPNYELGAMRIECRLETGEELVEAHVYLSRHGCLLVSGSAAAVREIAARYRALPAMGQRQVLEHVRDQLRPGQDLEGFILDCVAGEAPHGGALDRGAAP